MKCTELSCHLNAVAGQEPAGAVVGVLAAGLQVEVVEPPVLQLLAEVLDTHLQHSTVQYSTVQNVVQYRINCAHHVHLVYFFWFIAVC